MTSLRLAFMGSPDFAVPSLRAIEAAGHRIEAVYTQPPRPAGRGQKEQRSAVHAYAASRGWQVRTPTTLRDQSAQDAFAALDLDAAVVVAYGLILPPALLKAPRLGCLNVHASLLPRWRGAAPIQHAILAGDRETGITIMQMDAGLDTGPMLLSEAVPIGQDMTAAELHDGLATLGAELIVAALEGLDAGRLTARPQADDGVTTAPKLERREGRLDWRRPAEELERAVRAFTPWPGAHFYLPNSGAAERIKVLAAEVVERQPDAEPGEVLDDCLTVACGEGALRLTRVQRAGKAAMAVVDFLRGHSVAAGARLPLPNTAS